MVWLYQTNGAPCVSGTATLLLRITLSKRVYTILIILEGKCWSMSKLFVGWRLPRPWQDAATFCWTGPPSQPWFPPLLPTSLCSYKLQASPRRSSTCASQSTLYWTGASGHCGQPWSQPISLISLYSYRLQASHRLSSILGLWLALSIFREGRFLMKKLFWMRPLEYIHFYKSNANKRKIFLRSLLACGKIMTFQ
jgi:hypothetical protein